MRELANILRINKLEPIKDKDRIELATVENWQVVVQKGEFKLGDLVVYIEYDVLLPIRPEFEFLRKRCYMPSTDKFRIRNMKLGDVYSQGLVLPLSVLPEGTEIKEGLCVTDIIGAERYEKSELEEDTKQHRSKIKQFFFKYKIFRKWFLPGKSGDYPSNIKEADEVNIQKIFDKIKDKYKDDWWVVTEKMEGTSSCYHLNKKRFGYELCVYSHHKKRNNGKGVYEEVAKKYDIKNKLMKYPEYKNIALQGEICGPRIEGNIYGFDDLKFFVFRMINVRNGKVLSIRSSVVIANKLDIPFVPIVSPFKNLLPSVKEMLEYSNGNSVFGDTMREGMVWHHAKDGNISIKVKSPEYKGMYE